MNCPTCKAQMNPLFSSFFCPNDCDRSGPTKRVTHVDGSVWSWEVVPAPVDIVITDDGCHGYWFDDLGLKDVDRVLREAVDWGKTGPGPGWGPISAGRREVSPVPSFHLIVFRRIK